MKKSKKWGIKILILLLVLAIPLGLAFFILQQNLDDDLSKGMVTGLTLVHGKIEDEVNEKDDLDFFVSLVQSGQSIRETANPLSEYRKCRAVFHKLNRDVTYVFYLSDSVHNCVYTDPEGSLFLIPEKKAEKLLSHPKIDLFAVSYATYPTLTFRQGAESFGPYLTEGEWTHVNTDGASKPEKVKEKTDARVILASGDDLDFAFSLDPDFCSVTLQNEKGEILYSGDPKEMETVSMETDRELSLVVKCDWFEDNHKEYFGSITYSFNVFYDVPTECTLDRTTAAPGEMITLTVKHSSSEDLAVMPTFAAGQIQKVKGDGAWSILIPVSQTATAGEYSLMLMGSDVEKTFSITIAH